MDPPAPKRVHLTPAAAEAPAPAEAPTPATTLAPTAKAPAIRFSDTKAPPRKIPPADTLVNMRKAGEMLKANHESKGMILERLVSLLDNPRYHPYLLATEIPGLVIQMLLNSEETVPNRMMSGRIVCGLTKTNMFVHDLVTYGGGYDGMHNRWTYASKDIPFKSQVVVKNTIESWPAKAPFSFGSRDRDVAFFEDVMEDFTVDGEAFVVPEIWNSFAKRNVDEPVTLVGMCMYVKHMVCGLSYYDEARLREDMDMIWELSRVAGLAEDRMMLAYCDDLIFRIGRYHHGFKPYAEMFAACADNSNHMMLWCMAYAHYTHTIEQSEEVRLEYEAALDAVPNARAGILRHSFYSSF